MLGNTAFLSGATVGEIDSDVTELVLTIRNDVILPDGTQRRFLTSATQVYVELLPLTPSDTVFERLADAEDMEFAHDVWPPKLTVASYAAGMSQSPACRGLALFHTSWHKLRC